MTTHKVKAIVLSRTNYGEADKIATILTEDGEKLSIVAKGVRKSKSKLVAATEIFTVSEITYVTGKSQMYTVSSAKIVNQYTKFLNDLDKVHVAYDVLKKVNKYIDDKAGDGFYRIIKDVFSGLNADDSDAKAVELWAWTQILREAGHDIKLDTQVDNKPFETEAMYGFDSENGGFKESNNGTFSANHIKLLKICQGHSITTLARVKDCNQLSHQLNPMIKQFVEINT